MFHFPATPPTSLYIQPAATAHQDGWVTPFGNPGITVQLATPPGISQPHTSFIGHPAPRHPPCALHNLTNTRSNQIETKTLTHTIQISNNTLTTPDTRIYIAPKEAVKTPLHVRSMTRLRDVLSQNPNRVRDPKSPHRTKVRCRDRWVSRMDSRTRSPCNVQSTHHLKHLVHTHPQESRQPVGCQARPSKGPEADG